MSRPVVVVTRTLPAAVEQAFAAEFDVTLNATDTDLGPEGLKQALRSADAVVTTVTDKVTAEVIGVPGRRAKLIAQFGVGFNNIDIAAAKATGLAVSNTPDVLTDATADLAMTLLLMTARRAGEGERHVRAGQWTGWRPTHMMGTQVTGKTLGLIGFGRIAKAMARKAHHGFGMRILFSDPFPPSPEEARSLGAEARSTVEEVIAESDFVSLHCPATPETRHLINAARLALFRPGAILVNTARGDVCDEAALAAALTSGRLHAAGLDVFEQEPKVHPDLLALENVVLLPHLGSATTETRVAMGMRAFENARAFFLGQPLRDKVA